MVLRTVTETDLVYTSIRMESRTSEDGMTRKTEQTEHQLWLLEDDNCRLAVNMLIEIEIWDELIFREQKLKRLENIFCKQLLKFCRDVSGMVNWDLNKPPLMDQRVRDFV